MLLTNDQRFLLDILREVRYMRLDQILPLMRLRDPAKAKSHCEAILRYLRYGENWSPWETISYVWRSSGAGGRPRDAVRAGHFAVLAVGPPLQLTSRRPPYKLCFLLERERRGENRRIRGPAGGAGDGNSLSASFGAAVSGCDRAFVPVRIGEQHRLLHINQRHYFSSSGRRVACGSLRR